MNQEKNVMCAVERTSEVECVLSELSRVVQRYDHLMSQLHSRLASVVRAELPSPTVENKQIIFQTDLANRINDLQNHANGVTDGLESLLERLEL